MHIENLLKGQESSALKTLLADPNDRCLYITFHKWDPLSVYVYPLSEQYETIVNTLKVSKSIGAGYNKEVRGKFEGLKLENPEMLRIVKQLSN